MRWVEHVAIVGLSNLCKILVGRSVREDHLIFNVDTLKTCLKEMGFGVGGGAY